MAKGESSATADVHPMVAVPSAIRMVLEETAKVLLEGQSGGGGSTSVTLSVDDSWEAQLNRVLDQDVLMEEPGYPPYNASIMDGYAIRCSEFQNPASSEGGNDEQWTHRVIDKVFAGDEKDKEGRVGAKDDDDSKKLPGAYYITTGAVVPDTCDCVVPIEQCKVSSDSTKIAIQPTATIQEKKWIRPIGCDISAGSIVLRRGHVLDSAALGLLKQSGVRSIQVKRYINVGVLSTGNELILGSKGDANYKNEPQSKRQKGQIPDVNRPILLSLLSTYGASVGGGGKAKICQSIDLGMERDDDIQAMTKTIDAALETCDVIITTGGISMGETDIVEQVLVDHCHGKLHFGRMHMKPGKPTTFVTLHNKIGKTCLVFAMPGNPVSATVCTQLLVKPCLDLLFHGSNAFSSTASTTNKDALLNDIVDNALLHPELEGTLAHDVKLDSERPEYHRVVLEEVQPSTTSSGGENAGVSYKVSTTGVQRSSRLMSLRDAQGLLVLPQAKNGKVKALTGEKYPVLVLGNNTGAIKQVKLQDSIHLQSEAKSKSSRKSLQVAVIQVLQAPNGNQEQQQSPSLESVCDLIQAGLSGSKSGNAEICVKTTYSGPVNELYTFVVDATNENVDVIVVSCTSYNGAFPYHLDISASLRARLDKVADVLAMQARQGAASQDPIAALFEAVVGYVPEKNGAMLVCLADRGVGAGLGNIRGLLKHALNVGRSLPHNHHHSHQHHGHHQQ